MSDIHIERTFTMPVDELKQGIEKLAQQLQSEHGLKYQWDNDSQVSFQHKAAKGQVQISGDTVQLTFKLGLLYKPMAGVIRSQINALADEHLV